MENQVTFSLLLKAKMKAYMLQSFLGHVSICDLRDNERLMIPFTFYEIFYENLLSIIEYFLGTQNFKDDTNTIFIYEHKIIAWTPTIQNDEKNVKFSRTNEQNVIDFEMILNFDYFFNFLKGFTSSILPTLNLSESQKLFFQTLFFDDFDWSLIETNKDSNIIDRQLLIQFTKIKQDYSLIIDLSDMFQIFKFYLPLMLLLKKANGLMLLELDQS